MDLRLDRMPSVKEDLFIFIHISNTFTVKQKRNTLEFCIRASVWPRHVDVRSWHCCLLDFFPIFWIFFWSFWISQACGCMLLALLLIGFLPIFLDFFWSFWISQACGCTLLALSLTSSRPSIDLTASSSLDPYLKFSGSTSNHAQDHLASRVSERYVFLEFLKLQSKLQFYYKRQNVFK